MSENKKLNSMDILDILAALPHRYPFLLIDKVVDLMVEGENQYLVAVKNVTFNEPHFTGHFPNKPIFPGVLILEAMAQASGVLAVKSFGKQNDNELYYFVSVDDAKFRKPVVPGDQLEIRVDFHKERRGIFSFAAQAIVAGEVVCQAKLKVARR